ncbi:FHA domain-containing protein [Polymorphospora sp. 2-325]|uniref:FHA domain-containing protein n=1 Tax=Polymorphospora lycopeni TaxID=3140240 RepID=A0ABV5CVQ1_9ACTN
MSDDLPLLPQLTVTSGPLRGASFRLRPGIRTIGREDGVDIVVEDSRVSRRHAAVELTDGRATLSDVGSTNGTFLNDRRIEGVAVELRDGDRVRFGGVELRFFDPSAALTDPVGSVRLVGSIPAQRAIGASAEQRSAVGVLAEPTQAMQTARRSGRLVLVVGGVVMLAGWVAWVLMVTR